MTGSPASAREHALALVKERGWAVFPLAVGHDEAKCDGGPGNCKTVQPLVDWREESSADLETVALWDWSAANGYGIDCGKSDLFVVDVDPEGRRDWPETRVHFTGRGEHHVYEDLLYGLGSGTAVWPHVDTRGVGGMVLGPGSWHPHGEYAVAHDIDPAPVPAWVAADALAHQGPRRDRPARVYEGPSYDELTEDQRARADKHVEDTLLDWRFRLAEVAAWPEGQRDARGRGWEALSRDLAWAVAILAATPWAPPVGGEAEFEKTLPPEMLADPKCRKWRDDLPGKAAREVGPPPWLDPVFDATATLRHVRAAAHSRVLSARGLLLVTLARLAVEVPIPTRLPPVVGAPAPLNLGVALVGGSGQGKSAMFDVSRELLGLVGEDQRDLERGPGSGEGLIETYLGKPRDDGQGGKVRPLVADPRRLLYVDEIGQLGAVKDGRSGATVGPVLRSLLTGGLLGTENATAERRRVVPAGSSRAALVVGVQPPASDVLLNDYDARVGTPQRFAWAALTDPTIPDEDVAWPGPLGWEPPPWPAPVEYPEPVQAEVRGHARAAVRGERADDDARLDGHARLTRLKVAALLAALHGETEISDLWWRLAGVVADDWTAEAVAECRAEVSASRTRQAATAGRLRGHSRLAEEAVVDEDRARQAAVTATVLERLAEAGEEGLAWSALRDKVRRHRDVFDRLLGTPAEPGPLVESGQVRLTEVTVRGKPGVRVLAGAGR